MLTGSARSAVGPSRQRLLQGGPAFGSGTDRIAPKIPTENSTNVNLVAANKQVVDRIPRNGRRTEGSHQRDPPSSHTSPGNGCDVVAACHSVIRTVNPATQCVSHERAIDNQLRGFG